MLAHCRHVPKHACPHLEPLMCTPQEGLALPPAPQGEKPCSHYRKGQPPPKHIGLPGAHSM